MHLHASSAFLSQVPTHDIVHTVSKFPKMKIPPDFPENEYAFLKSGP
ncbi:Hypothetical protein Cp99MAT_1622 [Corynebacterium pseudotuberculosis]|nr:Hypothetical protein CpATCC19410_1643 [Corynebacterium pseudotuberculosis]AZN20411.1 hypothetical protein CpCap1W_1605 [Corynebacterium pseudotuberculosis]QBB95766.1 hypothetical protein CpCAPMI03_01614 [Corynebacterium pseudotuberculosis]QBB97880.1 hypothetical protein CpCAPMI05_01611 [Corynebacterium pseudotuberculosis]QBF71978.1 Hypothetical protein Cp99MAT_1622 [Corynebacterium pseudotuberculosis]